MVPEVRSQMRTMLVAAAVGLVFAGTGVYVGFVRDADHVPELISVPGGPALPTMPELPSLPPRPTGLPDLPDLPELPDFPGAPG
jgi:hypothetical protein